MPLPKPLQGGVWSASTARRILPLLVAYAEACRVVTYGELSSEVVRRRWGHYVILVSFRHPAGSIGFALEETNVSWEDTIPPIGALVVNEKTGLPGKGADYFLGRYLTEIHQKRRITKDQRESIVDEVHKDIYNYTGWRRLLEHYGLDTPPRLRGRKPKQQLTRKKYSWSSESESEAHKRLKTYISEHPELIGVGREAAPGSEEYVLPSADEIDVLFYEAGWLIGVEVKALNANDDDLLRGIFQCVKYRELLRAEQRIIPLARAVLVTERKLPQRLRKIAGILKVPCVEVALTVP